MRVHKSTLYPYKLQSFLILMSESQSRYSIVERLTQKKIDLMSEGLELDEEAKRKEQKVTQLKKELDEWENDIQQDIERNRMLKQREIEKAEMSNDNLKQRKSAKEQILKEKLNTLDKALERIEEISKASPTNQ